MKACYQHEDSPEPGGGFLEELGSSVSQPVETASDAIEATVNMQVLSRLQDHMANLGTFVAEDAGGLEERFIACPSANKAQFLRDINAQLEPLANDLEQLPKTFKIGKKIISDKMTEVLDDARKQMGRLAAMLSSSDWRSFALVYTVIDEEHADEVAKEATRATRFLKQIQATLRIIRDPNLATATNNNAVNVLYAGLRLLK